MGILTTTFRQAAIRAATPENPRFSLNDPAAWDALGVTRSDAGIPINREIAFTYSPWWRGINLVSGDAAKLPLHINKRAGRGKIRDERHPAFVLLRRRSNERQTAFHWKKLMVVHAMAEGNGYSYIVRDGAGRPLELLPLDPQATTPVLANGQMFYVTTIAGEQRKLLPENVFHLAGMGWDGLRGYSVWQKALNDLGLAIGTNRYATTTLKNNGRPSLILTHPSKLTKDTAERVVRDWDRMHAGINNAARTAILDQGMQAKEISFTPRQNELTTIMEIQIRVVAAFLGVPAHKLGDTSRTAFSSLEQENLSYLSEGLDPWLVNMEDQAHDKLLAEDEKNDESHAVEFDRRAIMLADLSSRANYFRTALGGAPWMKENEVRDFEGLEPNEGGDEMKRPLNMGQGGADKEPAPPSKPTETPKDSSVPDDSAPDGSTLQSLRSVAKLVVLDVAGRTARRIAVHAERAAGKGGDSYCQWLELFEHEQREAVCEICHVADSALQALAVAGDADLQLPGQLADWMLAALRVEWAHVADTATPKDLQAAVGAAREAIETKLRDDAVAIFLEP